MSEREWRFYLDDMITFAEKVLTYTRGLDQTGFEANEQRYDATLRNLELIGEAAMHVPVHTRKRATYSVAPDRRHPQQFDP